MDFEKICRLCLEPNELTFDIFTNFCLKTNILIQEMLAYCTKVTFSKDDGLPKQICKECTKHLKKTYIFNIQVEKSDKKLRLYLENVLRLEQHNGGSDRNNVEIKDENYEEIHSEIPEGLDFVMQNNIKNDIKIEQNIKDEECWDADDNVNLDQIKSTNAENENIDEPLKKKNKKKKPPKHPVPSKKPHQCDICGKILSTKSNLMVHKICHTDIRAFKCDICNSAFRGHSALRQHKRIHTGEKPYHCNFCAKKFMRRANLINHIRTHTGEKLYSCKVCDKSFTQSAQLSVHMKRHNGEKPYLCQDCGKGFSLRSDLKVHERIHTGEKPYRCSQCPKSFATSGNMSLHLRIHNNDIRYTCPECNRGFLTSSAYNVHIKRHKGQRDYPCECGKTFYTLTALKQHTIVHTGEKKYQCKVCDRKFTQGGHLSRHVKKEHSLLGVATKVQNNLQTGKVYKIDRTMPTVMAESCELSQR